MHFNYRQYLHYNSKTLDNIGEYIMGGFDFLIAYDASALTFMGAEPGQLLEDCEWEYFTWRFVNNCGTRYKNRNVIQC